MLNLPCIAANVGYGIWELGQEKSEFCKKQYVVTLNIAIKSLKRFFVLHKEWCHQNSF